MAANIAHILLRECQVEPHDLLILGLSGGPDSLYLLHVLSQFHHPVIAVHVNHGLRPEAAREQSVVSGITAQIGVDFVPCQVDVQGFARQNSISIEEAARELRYRALFEVAESRHARAVVVGHTADDQVETILMHLLRGSGLPGLGGIEYHSLPNPWNQTIPLVRPLLSTWRSEIEAYLGQHSLHPVIDVSNREMLYTRNRVRHELLPLLERYNPNIHQTLLRMGESLKEDYAILENLTEEAWQTSLVEQGDGYLSLRTQPVLSLPIAIQRYLLRKAIAYHLPSLRDVGFECIERGLSVLAGANPSAMTNLIGELRLVKDGGQFWVVNGQAELPRYNHPRVSPGMTLSLPVSSTIQLGDGWRLQVEEVLDPGEGFARNGTDPDLFQAWLDVSKLSQPLSMRARRPGDYIQPLGMQGRKVKISDLMINAKLPRRWRETWPLVCSGDEILWVPGVHQSHLAQVKPSTLITIHLTLSRSGSA